MDTVTIRALTELNNTFYRENHESFSKSRQSSWPGWERVRENLAAQDQLRESALEGAASDQLRADAAMPAARDDADVPADASTAQAQLLHNAAPSAHAYRILDVASGNMRFERFMAESFPRQNLAFTCIDSCPELATERTGVRYLTIDVIDLLMEGRSLARECGELFDAAVSFGFMHHIPGGNLRESFIRQLAGTVRPGATISLSFWRFMDDPKLANRALRTTAEYLSLHSCALEANDYLLGWDARAGAYRYCHHFTDAEIDALVATLADTCEVVDRFRCDGRTAALNTYLILRRRP